MIPSADRGVVVIAISGQASTTLSPKRDPYLCVSLQTQQVALSRVRLHGMNDVAQLRVAPTLT